MPVSRSYLAVVALLLVGCLSPQALQAQSSDAWQRPEGPAPAWLKAGEERLKRMAQTRKALARRVSFDFEGVPLHEAMQAISRQINVPIRINDIALDDNGNERNEPVTGRGREVRVSAMSEQLLSQFDLTLVVHESDLEVTSKDAAESQPSVLVYDVAFKASGSGNLNSLVQIIGSSIDPDQWRDFGGTGDSFLCDMGSALLVSSTDETHRKIAEFLSSLVTIPTGSAAVFDAGTSTPRDALVAPGKMTLPAGRNYTLIRMVPVKGTFAVPAKDNLSNTAEIKKFEPVDTKPAWLDEYPQAEEDDLRAMLFEPVSVDIKGQPLSEAVKQILDTHRIEYWINAVALDDAGVTPDQPVTFTVKDTSVHEALDRLLSPLSLAYRLDGSRVIITAEDDAQRQLSRRIYNLAYLSDKPIDLQSFLLALTNLVNPEDWRDYGGTGDATILPIGSQLVIAASENTFFKIDCLMAQLRQIKPSNFPSASQSSSTTK